MTRVVLGSASAGRLAVLRRAGIDPLVLVSGVDEDAVLAAHPDSTPAAAVCALSGAKADDVARRLDADVAADCVVIGCDSMLLLDGRLTGKPGSAERAAAQWKTMAGRAGELLTGHSVRRLQHGEVTHRVDETACTTVYFADPTPDELHAYLATGEPLGVAGGFTLDGFGGWFVERIDGDASNVIGLSLPLTRELLRRTGLSLAALWTSAEPAER